MSDVLARIFAAKMRAGRADEAREPFDAVHDRALARKGERRPFAAGLRAAGGPAIIAEIKRASPSAGLISSNFQPAQIAVSYDRAGVDAISVLTEAEHFLGELRFLDMVRAQTTRPILRKDFLSTRYDVAQSAAYGADAILLIVGGLPDEALQTNMTHAKTYDLDVLVEVHDERELKRAIAAGATLLGINNRDLRTFKTDLAVSKRLIPLVPPEVQIVSESGFRSAADVARLYACGARAFLIGETLMRAADRSALVKDFKAALAQSEAF